MLGWLVMVLASTVPTCESSEMPLELLHFDRSPSLYKQFDGAYFSSCGISPPVPHSDEDGTEALQTTRLVVVVVVVDLEQFGGEEVEVDRLPVPQALRCRLTVYRLTSRFLDD